MVRRAIMIIVVLTFVQIGINAQNSVKVREGVEIGGRKQWIGAISDDDSKPLLLFLHGGPGFSSRAYSKKFIKILKKEFIVAQWDQRETGITAAWASTSDSLSLDLMHSDTREVVEYLLRKFEKKKLYLVGFSWGGFLGLHLANEHPELLHAYISVSAMIHGDKSERLTLEIVREKARQINNTQALEEMSKIKVPFTSWEQLYYQRKWTAHFLDEKTGIKNYPESLFEQWSVKWMTIFQEASKVDYSKAAPVILCPIYFFLSEKDFVSNHKVAQDYFFCLKADKKQMIWFRQSAHEIPVDEPKKFSAELIKIAQSLD